jgi:hypothetical protein
MDYSGFMQFLNIVDAKRCQWVDFCFGFGSVVKKALHINLIIQVQ